MGKLRDLARLTRRSVDAGVAGFSVLLVLWAMQAYYVHEQLLELQRQNVARTARTWRDDDTVRWVEEFTRRHKIWEHDNNLTPLEIPSGDSAKIGK